MKLKLVRRGERPIELRIQSDATRDYLSSGIKVAASNWNAKTQFVKRGHPNQDHANERLQALVALAEKRYVELLENGIPKAKDIKAAMKRPTHATGVLLSAWIQERLKLSTNQKNTNSKVLTTCTYLEKWPGHCPVSAFDAAALDGFQNWLLEQKSYRGHGTLSRSTVKNYLYAIKAYIGDAHRFGMIDRNPFNGWSMKNTTSTPYPYLTVAELVKFKEVDAVTLHEREVKDAFLFMCATGPRIGDMESMPLSAIRSESDGLHFRYKPGKTSRHKNAVIVDLHLDNLFGGVAMRIAAPRVRKGGDLLFRLGARSQSLVVLKRLCARCGIRLATWHWARETCGTQLLNAGYSLEMVKAVLGHKSIATTERYARMLKETINQQAKNVWGG